MVKHRVKLFWVSHGTISYNNSCLGLSFKLAIHKVAELLHNELLVVVVAANKVD